MSRPYAEVIGDPISHSKSPLIHKFWLGKLGIDAEYRACHVSDEDLVDYFASRRGDPDWRGCNVTIPHKVEVLRFADETDRTVEYVGAANCIVPRDGKLSAFNTDVQGVSAAIPFDQVPCCLIGAGGAARATIPELSIFLGMCDLRIIARDKARAAAAFADLDDWKISLFGFDDAEQAMANAQAVINASPLGMAGQPPMPQSVLDAIPLTDPQSTVFDMVYAPLETELLKTARAHGRKTVDGLVMLIGQAKGAFELFFGQKLYSQYDAELRALLTR